MHKQTTETDSGQSPRYLWDAIVLVGFAAFWLSYVGPIVIHEHLHGVDVFRDIGTAVNMQQGRYLADPAYAGETLWYPPLSPFIVAQVSSLFQVSPLDCYRWSQLLFNWMIPAGLYLLVRMVWGRRAAALGTVALLLAMPWWQAEIAHGQPSIHAIIWGWLALLLYGVQHRRRSMRWAMACGVFQAVSFWHHPFVPTLLSAGFLLQTFWAHHRQPARPGAEPTDPGMIRRNLLIAAVTLAMASPILVLMIHGPIHNPLPRDYLAEELRTIAFPLMHGNLWLWATGALGVAVCAARADCPSRLLVSCLGVAAAAQLPGYLRMYGGEWAAALPTLVPHEFQRLFQVGWAIAIGIGLDATIRTLATRVGDPRNRRRAVVAMTLAGAVITGAWGLVVAPSELRRFLQNEPLPARFDSATRWIMANTSIDDVFACEAAMAFHWLHWSTGRKVWLLTQGHSNPRVDWRNRDSVLTAMEDAPSPQAFWDLARENGISFFIPSAEWNPRAIVEPGTARADVFRYVRLVYGDRNAVAIYRVLDSPTP